MSQDYMQKREERRAEALRAAVLSMSAPKLLTVEGSERVSIDGDDRIYFSSVDKMYYSVKECKFFDCEEMDIRHILCRVDLDKMVKNKSEEKKFDDLYNEGAEGYNPYR